MKKIILLLSFNLLITYYLSAQIFDDTTTVSCNIIGIVPSNVDKINGLAIGWSMLSDQDKLIINGLYTNLSPAQLYMGPILTLGSVWTLFGDDGIDIDTDNGTIYGEYTGVDSTRHDQSINGISLSIVEYAERTEIKGLEISMVYQHTFVNNGVSISGLLNFKTKYNGLMIGLINIAEKGTGLQIGLVNNCGNLRGFQIGLINRCGSNLIPFINCRFSYK